MADSMSFSKTCPVCGRCNDIRYSAIKYTCPCGAVLKDRYEPVFGRDVINVECPKCGAINTALLTAESIPCGNIDCDNRIHVWLRRPKTQDQPEEKEEEKFFSTQIDLMSANAWECFAQGTEESVGSLLQNNPEVLLWMLTTKTKISLTMTPQISNGSVEVVIKISTSKPESESQS